ncbi:TIGR03089 family protein [Nocardiopsis chromatogenes]|uniref:TIGR03089 family protein n=1 Tax=Nocardiopsis chromatogenes TaxID=280239 RepID=UPI00034AEA1E|nr:TIGR03089 family protein [Nocardiopsis chromatogenes]
MPADTPALLWRDAHDADPSRPFVTAYDGPVGGRVELSGATFGNWVAKTANMLADGLGAVPGERVALALPVHWQSLAWLVACWSVGAVPVLPDDAGTVPEADIAVADADRIGPALDSGAREAVAASLHPLGAPLPDCPPAALDYADEVRGYGDRHTPAPAAADPGHPALESGGRTLTAAELAGAARDLARTWELTDGDRVAIITSAREPLGALGPDLSRFLAPLSRAVPLVLTPGIDSANLQSRLDMERATALVGAPPGTPAPSGGIRPLS